MALSVALPPMPPLISESAMNTIFTEPSGAFPRATCGFEPYLPHIKAEPHTPQDPGPPPPPSTFHHSFHPLSSANFPYLKHGNADLYPSSSEGQEFSSWAYKHPEHWQAREVLDWVFSLAEEEGQGGHLDAALLRGEAYNSLTGRQLCDMSFNDFLALDERYGARLHDVFSFLREEANFKQPLPPDSFHSECFHGGYPPFDYSHVTDDVKSPQQPLPPATAPSMSVYVDRQGREMTVSLDGLGLYDIDVDFTSLAGKDPAPHRPMDDSDYHSGSEGSTEMQAPAGSSDILERLISDDDDDEEEEEENAEEGEEEEGEEEDRRIGGGVVMGCTGSRKPHMRLMSSSCDSGCEGEEGKPPARKRQTSASKGNHLWEFIRDLLKNPVFNPSLVRWEDRDMGVFKFVQSEAVAQLWGRKKNNPQMTYEKLSRAMRFCRSAGYFESVPKTGRFPKKLCFKFGHKAHGWQE